MSDHWISRPSRRSSSFAARISAYLELRRLQQMSDRERRDVMLVRAESTAAVDPFSVEIRRELPGADAEVSRSVE